MISGLEPSWTALVARVVATAKIKPQCSQILDEGGQNERLVALGRKNALFAGSESGARTWAILASLINTAKLNDLDPQTYLADVLERMISVRTPVNRLEELLAWNWKAARDALATAAAQPTLDSRGTRQHLMSTRRPATPGRTAPCEQGR